jgi:hypothetical protein
MKSFSAASEAYDQLGRGAYGQYCYDMLNTSTAATETMPSKSRPVVAFSQPIRPEAFQESDRSTGLDG